MVSNEPWVGTWRPHKPIGPIAAVCRGPGPKYALPGLTGSFDHDPTKYKAPMYSFGARLSAARSDCSPGPKYLLPSNITRNGRDGTPAFSLYSRPMDPKLSQFPGPGKYSPENSGKLIFHSAPAFSLSGRSKEGRIIQTPGPASYTLPPVLGPKTVVTSTAPTFSIYGRSKTGCFYEDLGKSPGPAAYNVVDPSVYRQKPPQYSMYGRNVTLGGRTQTPGPGAHFPEKVTVTKAKAPSFTFGLRHSQFIMQPIDR